MYCNTLVGADDARKELELLFPRLLSRYVPQCLCSYTIGLISCCSLAFSQRRPPAKSIK